MKSIALTITVALAFAGCSTTTGDATKDARGRATNQALAEAVRVLGSIAVSSLLNIAQQEASGSKVDFASAASAGLWANTGSIVSSGSIERVIGAYSAGKLPQTAQVAATVFASKRQQQIGVSDQQVTNAIATVISTAAGAPPAK